MRKRTINNMHGGYRGSNQQTYGSVPIKPGEDGKDNEGKDDEGKDKNPKIIIKPNIGISVGSAIAGLATGITAGLTAYHFYQKNRRDDEPIIPSNRGLGYEGNIYERQPSIGLQTSFTVNDLPASGQNYDPDRDQNIEFDPQSSLFRPDESRMFALFNPEEDQPEPEEEEEEDPREFKYNSTYDVAKLSNEDLDRESQNIERELAESSSKRDGGILNVGSVSKSRSAQSGDPYTPSSSVPEREPRKVSKSSSAYSRSSSGINLNTPPATLRKYSSSDSLKMFNFGKKK